MNGLRCSGMSEGLDAETALLMVRTKPWMLASVVYVSFAVSDSEMDNFLVAGSNHGGMEGQISGAVAEAPLTSHDPARSVA